MAIKYKWHSRAQGSPQGASEMSWNYQQGKRNLWKDAKLNSLHSSLLRRLCTKFAYHAIREGVKRDIFERLCQKRWSNRTLCVSREKTSIEWCAEPHWQDLKICIFGDVKVRDDSSIPWLLVDAICNTNGLYYYRLQRSGSQMKNMIIQKVVILPWQWINTSAKT